MRYGSWHSSFLAFSALASACGDVAKSPSGESANTEQSAGAQSGNAQTSAAAGRSAAGSGTPSAPRAGSNANPSAASAAGSGGAQAGSAGEAQAGAAGPALTPTAGAAAAGSGGTEQPAAGSAGEPAARPRRAVSADFLGKTLSIVDVDKLKPGAKRADALLGSVDLSMYTPGPLAVAVTPDGKTAVVSISAGWLGLVGTTVPPGDGTLVFVDLDTLTVKGELNTGRVPMGILITPDGTHAYVGMMSETYMAYVDIEKRSYERIATGNSWNEELAIDDTGTVAILTTGTAGNALTFTPQDGATTNGQTLGLNADAAGTAFFPGTKLAYVVQAPTQLTGYLGGYNVIDATDPGSPMVVDELRVPDDQRISYPATSVPSRMSVVYPSTDSGTLSLIEMGLEGQKAVELQKVEVGAAQQLAYGLHCDERGRVLVAVPTDHYVALVDLNTKESTIVPWEITETGPVDIKYIP